MTLETLLKELNPHQRAAATFARKHALVLAGAGTGKTKTIVARAAHLIAEGTPTHRIHILTFTRRAASEIVQRVKLHLGEQATGLRASTFHTFCMSLIHQAPNLFGVKGYSVIDREDQIQLFRMVRGGVAKKGEQLATAVEICNLYSYARNTGKSLSDTLTEKQPGFLTSREKIAEIVSAYQARKHARKYLDYDDILDVVVQAMRQSQDAVSWVAGHFEHLLVDEMQDTNPLQWQILDPLKSQCVLFCVGDDAQSIYKFRGADFKNIHSFNERVPSSTQFKLTENYRSTQEILDVSNWLLDQSPLKYDKRLMAVRGTGVLPQFHNFPNEWEEAGWIASDIQQRRNDAGDQWSEHMILTRTAFGARAMESALLAAEIPYIYVGGTKLLESAHVRDMLSLVRIIGNPSDELAILRYLTLFHGVGEVTANRAVEAMLATASLNDAILTLKNQKNIPLEAAEGIAVVAKSLNNVAGAIRDSVQFLEKILESKYQNQDWPKRRRDFTMVKKLAERHTSILSFIEEYLLDPVHTTQIREDSTPDVVTLITIHSAKGTECKTCYLLNAGPGAFPSRFELASVDEVEESRRTLYVALTRAKDNLLVTRRSFSQWATAEVADPEIEGYFFSTLPEGLFELIEHGQKKSDPISPEILNPKGYKFSGGINLS